MDQRIKDGGRGERQMSPDEQRTVEVTSPDLADQEVKVTCPTCLHPNTTSSHFCEKCGAPISNLSVVGPWESIQADGFALRQAVSGHPRKVIVVGMWLILFPQVIGLLYLALHEGAYGALIFVPFGTIILYRVTRNYITKRQTPNREYKATP